jgi:hypothetical protein
MLTITLASLVVAAASGCIAWRSIRREHLRAEARVASLASAIDSSPARDNSALDDAFEWFGPEEDPTAPVATIFEEDAHPAAQRRPLLTAAAGLAVVLAVVVLIAMTGNRYDAAQPPVVSPRVESLELLSLRAAREGASLAVTGVVRNRADEPLNAITAIVSAMDAQGRAIGSGSVPLAALSPGHESRFVVTIARASGVARYRVSFRGATGVLRHLDRRADRTSDMS